LSPPAAPAHCALPLHDALPISTDNTVTYDGVSPTVTINQAAAQPDLTNASPISFTVVFSESVTGFTGSDVSFAGSTVGGTLVAAVSGTGPTYRSEERRVGDDGTGGASIPACAAQDADGDSNAASTWRHTRVACDGISAMVTINQAAGQADPTNASPISFTVVFSESVTGFTGSDVSFAGSTVGGTLVAAVSGTGPTY